MEQRGELPQKPIRRELLNGRYKCFTCVPMIDVKADGTDQRVSAPGFDTVSVSVIDDRTVAFTYKKAGATVRSQKLVIGPDGSRLTSENRDQRENDSQPNSYTVIDSRIEEGPAGSHAISGEWKRAAVTSVSDSALIAMFKVADHALTMTKPREGGSYTAKFDGKDYPLKGDPMADAVSLRRIDSEAIEEIDKKDGKVVEVYRYTLSPDGRTMTVVYDNKFGGGAGKFTMKKQ